MKLAVVNMVTEGAFLLRLSVTVYEGEREYNYTLLPEGIDLVSIKEPSTSPASTFAMLLGGPQQQQTAKDVVMPYSHIEPLLDLWDEKSEQLRRMRDSGTQ